MPNEFEVVEVDEKLTIAKNKPRSIEITEGTIKCPDLYILTDHLAVEGPRGHIATENGIIRTGRGNINADFVYFNLYQIY